MLSRLKWLVLTGAVFLALRGYACPGTAAFSFPSPWCMGAAVTFTNTSTGGAASYTWVWGDASANTIVANTASQTHTYAAVGSYTISLVRTFGSGCKDTLNQVISIINNPPPPPTFTFTPSGGCSTLPFHFTNTTGNGSLSYSWNFGDPSSGGQNTSTNNNPSHNFTATGNGGSTTYNVTLTATNSNGCSTTTTQVVTVSNRPNAALADSNVFAPFNNCGNASLTNPSYHLTVMNTSTTTASNVNYNISWGDATPNFNSSTFTQVSHTYLTLGVYNIVLIVTGTNGCTDTAKYQAVNLTNPSVGLTGPGATTGCAPQTFTFTLSPDVNNINFTTYTFYFGDNTPPVTMVPPIPNPPTISHTYNSSSCGQPGNQFTVKVTAHNACDSTSSTVNNIKISTKPTSTFTASPSPGCLNTPVTFINTTTPGCYITGSTANSTSSFTWNFGDGSPTVVTTSTAPQVHTYTVLGNYTVTLNASNPCGNSTYSFVEKIIGPPVALFTHTNGGCVPILVTTNNQSTLDSLSYNWTVSPGTGWSFANATNASSTNAQFNFTLAGTYTITLTTTNPCGVSRDTAIVHMVDKPVVVLAAIPNACGSASITPAPTYTTNGAAITSYSWSFPGGTPSSSTISNPGPIVYSSPGTYTVTVTVTNACGSSTTSKVFNVFALPFAEAGNDTTICHGQTVHIGTAALGGLTYSWASVPTGFTSTAATANVTPNVTTAYIVTVTNSNGCISKDTINITVNPIPVVSAGPAQTLCINAAPINLTGTPGGGTWSGTGITNTSLGTFDPSVSGIGTFTISYSYTSLGCTGTSTVVITVVPLPVVNAGTGQTYCNQAGTVTLTGYTPAGGSWSGTGVTSGGVFTPTTAGVGTTVLTYTYTDIHGCSSSDTINVNVVNPVAAVGGPNDTMCVNGGPITLTGFSPPGGTWTGTGITNPSGIFSPSVSGAGTFTLTYHYGSGTCATTATITAVVHALPVMVAGPNQSLCIGSPAFNFTGFSPSGGTWTGTGITNGSLGTFDPSVSGTGTFTLTYSFTDTTTHCSNSATKQVTVNPLPVVNAGTGNTYCNQTIPVTLAGFTPPGGTWSGTGVTGAGVFTPSVAGNGTTILTYTFTNGNGCTNTDTIQVHVIPAATAVAGPNDTVCISAAPYNFTGFTPPGGSWSGTGITNASLGTFSPAIAGVGSHTETYTYGTGTCLNTSTKVVIVNPLPVVTAGSNQVTCVSTPAFNLTGFTPAGGAWSGTGISSPTPGTFNPALAGAGTFTLTYTYTDPVTHCTNSATKTILVGALPVVQFTNPPTGCIGTPIAFNNTTTGAAGYSWNFGDGGNTTTQNPTYSYTAYGTYTVHLIATSSNGCVDSLTSTIQMLPVPVASFTTSADTGCAPLVLNFTNASTTAFTTYSWNFGNGQTSTAQNPPPQTYNQGIGDTTYYFSLNVSNLCASSTYRDSVIVLPIPEAGFGTTLSSGCSPATFVFVNTTTGNALTYTWNFGDGTFGTGLIPPSHNYYYTGQTDTVYHLSMIASNACGSDTAYWNVTVYPNNVHANFNTSAISGCMPHSVNFTNLATGATYIGWDFGDGNQSTQLNPSHTYLLAGTYTVSQYANNGCSYDTTHVVITVYPLAGLGFTSAPVPACTNQPITFTNTSTNAGGYVWHFGDGNTSILNNPTHPYALPGTYTVTLVGTSMTYGCLDSIQQVVTVSQPPVPSFTPNVTFGCMPLAVTFLNTSTNSVFYTWEFGDGNTTGLSNPSHLFTTGGTYSVTLVAQSSSGCMDSVKIPINVYPEPVAAFVPNPPFGCNIPTNVVFNNATTGATTYAWNFGNSSTSTNVNGSASYTANGTYTVQLIATSSYGCVDTTSSVYTVSPSPEAQFTPSIGGGCQPVTVTFNNVSQPGVNYSWTFGDGGNSTQVNPTYTYNTPGVYSVMLLATSTAGCQDTMLLTNIETINPTPEAAFTYTQEYSNGTPNGTISFLNTSTGANSYSWSFGDGGTASTQNPIHQYASVGSYTVSLIVSNSFGCTDTSIQVITVDYFEGLFVPNAFIPGSSFGEAAIFMPKGKSLKEYHIQIFNTWGTLLWESTALDASGSPSEYWDGYYNGVLCQQDAYVWKIYAMFDNGTVWAGKKYPNGERKVTGTVTLIR